MIGKFRCWHKEYKLMYPVKTIDFSNKFVGTQEMLFEFDKVILMQSIDIRDSSAFLVYEGDIVKNSYNVNGRWFSHIGEIIYNNSIDLFPACSYLIKFKNGFEFIRSGIIEVLGNKFENTELLEKYTMED